MLEHDCGVILAVREDGKLAGVITDRDICIAAYTEGKALDQILVNAVMAKRVLLVRPDDKLGEAVHVMTQNQIRRLPVVDAAGKPVGVLSLNDLAIESVQPDTRMKNAFSNIAHTLAAVCEPRRPRRHAA
jgi:CBS domain-containing protein